MDLETLGLFGVFLAGAIPWFEAIAIVPLAIIFGLDPVLVVLYAVVGNTITIFLFAYMSDQIRSFLRRRRSAAGKSGESKKLVKAQEFFDRYGIYGVAALGPVLIGTQFAAAISVAAGVKPLKASLLITLSTLLWASAIAIGFVFFDLDKL
jgi:membrane protein YqaA with SNARE-associated domain